MKLRYVCKICRRVDTEKDYDIQCRTRGCNGRLKAFDYNTKKEKEDFTIYKEGILNKHFHNRMEKRYGLKKSVAEVLNNV